MAKIEELAGRVFATRNAAHLQHWATRSFSEHMALGEFYDAIIDKVDKIIEAYQGAYGLIGDVTIPKVDKGTITEHIAEEAGWIDDNRDELSGGIRAIQNLIDDLVDTYLTVHYKLTALK